MWAPMESQYYLVYPFKEKYAGHNVYNRVSHKLKAGTSRILQRSGSGLTTHLNRSSIQNCSYKGLIILK